MSLDNFLENLYNGNFNEAPYLDFHDLAPDDQTIKIIG